MNSVCATQGNTLLRCIIFRSLLLLLLEMLCACEYSKCTFGSFLMLSLHLLQLFWNKESFNRFFRQKKITTYSGYWLKDHYAYLILNGWFIFACIPSKWSFCSTKTNSHAFTEWIFKETEKWSEIGSEQFYDKHMCAIWNGKKENTRTHAHFHCCELHSAYWMHFGLSLKQAIAALQHKVIVSIESRADSIVYVRNTTSLKSQAYANEMIFSSVSMTLFY